MKLSIFICLFFICFSIIYCQPQVEVPLIFDDFNYTSVQFPIESDSSGSLFGKNQWFTENGIVSTRAWRRYNRGDPEFGPHVIASADSGYFRLGMLKGFQTEKEHGPLIVSGFLTSNGTYTSRLKFGALEKNNPNIQAFWLTSPLYFHFYRAGDKILYWSEMDFEYNNYFLGDGHCRVQVGHNNRNGRPPKARPLDCVCKEGENIIPYPECVGDFRNKSILAEQWYELMIVLDSNERTLKFAMKCDSLSGMTAKIWAGANPSDFEQFLTFDNYFPDYILNTVYSLHAKTAGVDQSMLVDWFCYSPRTNLNFNDVENLVKELKDSNISRLNTTGIPLIGETLSEEPGIITIVGPDTINSNELAYWKLVSSYQRYAGYDIDFQYRYYDSSECGDWISVFAPELTLAPPNRYNAVELKLLVYDFWGDYHDTCIKLVKINSSGNDNEFRNIILHPAFPNPVELSSQIDFEILKPADISLIIYDLLGKPVQILRKGKLDIGTYSDVFDASKIPSGMYYCRLSDGKENKICLIAVRK